MHDLINVSVRHASDLTRHTSSPFIRANIIEVLNDHGDLDLSCLAKVCLGCGSIAMAATNEDRDNLVAWYDFTCHANQTYVFLSPPQV